MAPFLYFLTPFGLAFLLTALLRFFLNRTEPYGRSGSATPVPIPPFGGLAFVPAIFLVFLFPPNPLPTGVWPGAIALAMVGFFDDVWPLSPLWKVIWTVMGAALAVGLGLRVQLVNIPVLDGVLTVMWLVWMCHGFNVLDMEDGLSAGCGAIAGVGLGLLGWFSGTPILLAVGLALAGGLVGFWIHNAHPARIYMGDTGSLFVGFLLGAMGIGVSRVYPEPWGYLGAFLVLGVVSFEVVIISIARFAKGRPISRPSRDHVAQRLVQNGCTVWGAVLRMYGVAIFLVLAGMVVVEAQGRGWVVVVIFGLTLWAGRFLLGVDMEGDGVDGRQAGLWSKNWVVHRAMRQTMAGLSSRVSGRLLDVGCGGRPFEALFQVRAYVGMEWDRDRYREARIDVWGDTLALPFAQSGFETVLCNQVLEHVREPEQALREMGRVLKSDGCLILTAPHIWGLHEEPYDYYRYTPFGLRHLAEKAGLKVEQITAMAGYWVTAGVRFCYYLEHFERGLLIPFVRLAYLGVQCCSLALDQLHRVEGDAWNHVMVARKP